MGSLTFGLDGVEDGEGALEPRVERGVDVGAREEIYSLIETLAASGVAIVLISSDLKELIGVAQRILVVRDARVVAELPPDAQERDIVEAFVPALPALPGAVAAPCA